MGIHPERRPRATHNNLPHSNPRSLTVRRNNQDSPTRLHSSPRTVLPPANRGTYSRARNSLTHNPLMGRLLVACRSGHNRVGVTNLQATRRPRGGMVLRKVDMVVRRRGSAHRPVIRPWFREAIPMHPTGSIQ